MEIWAADLTYETIVSKLECLEHRVHAGYRLLRDISKTAKDHGDCFKQLVNEANMTKFRLTKIREKLEDNKNRIKTLFTETIK